MMSGLKVKGVAFIVVFNDGLLRHCASLVPPGCSTFKTPPSLRFACATSSINRGGLSCHEVTEGLNRGGLCCHEVTEE